MSERLCLDLLTESFKKQDKRVKDLESQLTILSSELVYQQSKNKTILQENQFLKSRIRKLSSSSEDTP